MVMFALMLLLWVMLPPNLAWADGSDTPDSPILNPRSQHSWVSDAADVLTPDTEQRLNQLLTQLEQTTTIEMAVVTVPASVPVETPKAFTTELFNTWGVGKADRNNGVLMAIFPAKRRIEIETGVGMAERLPDDRVADIIQTNMVPAFRAGNLDQGIWAGAIAIVQDLNPAISLERDSSWLWPIALVGLVGAIATGVGIFQIYQIRQRPIPLPPTGRQTYSEGQFVTVRIKYFLEQSFDGILRELKLMPSWPAMPLVFLSVGLVMLNGAIAAGLSAFSNIHPWNIVNIDSHLLVAGLIPLVTLPAISALRDWATQKNSDLVPALIVSFTVIPPFSLSLFGVLLLVDAPLMTWLGIPLSDHLRILEVALYVTCWNVAMVVFVVRDWIGCSCPVTQYVCATCEQAVSELSDRPQLYKLFGYSTDPEYRVAYRAWHCPQCHPEITADGLFLVEAREKHITPPPLYVGKSSGSTSQSATRKSSGSVSSRQTPSSRSSLPNPRQESSTWDVTTDISSSASSAGSDFGGGSSDGGGAGGDW
jgi:uncharacterized membrane protein YgcG